MTPFLSKRPPNAFWASALALFALLISVYAFIYSGTFESGDSRFYMNVTASLYRFGDTRLDMTNDRLAPQAFTPGEAYPLTEFDVEIAHPLLALPLYALADRVPGLGLVHTTWTFNIFVTALTGVLLLATAQQLGYDLRTGLVAAVAFGCTTAALVYSKTFFREPLTGFTILLSVHCGLRLRASSYRPLWIVLLAASVGLMLLTRAAAIFALPALFIVVFPSQIGGVSARRFLLSGLVVGALAASAVGVGALLGGGRYDFLGRLASQPDYVISALHTYLISPGASLWATSPVLLLALPGVWLFWRRTRRLSMALVVLLLTYALGYALFIDRHWFGGLSWPPRFLVPLIPTLMIGTLPLFARALQRGDLRLRIIAAVLCAVGLWVSFTGASVRWIDYMRGLPPDVPSEWGGGLNTLAYLRPVVIPQLWPSLQLDFAWVRAQLPLWGAASALGVIVSGFWLLSGKWRLRYGRRVSSLLLTAAILSAGLGLRALYDLDFEYNAGDPGLRALLDTVDVETASGDVVVLSNPAYSNFFLNYAKLHDAARIISLSEQPGDRPSEAQPPQIVSDLPELLIQPKTIPQLFALAETRSRIWLVENLGPTFPWAVRPVERFFAAHFYPLRDITLSTQVRLIAFSTQQTLDPTAYLLPDHASGLTFDDHIRLLGYTLPYGTRFHAGDAIPISMAWSAEQALDDDYTVGLYLRASDGSPIAQSDSAPGWGFAPTHSWPAGAVVWDQRALVVPESVPAGTYQVWVKLYRFDANYQPIDAGVSGGGVLDEVIGVLDIVITIE